METERHDRLRDAAIESLGPEGYDRLVISVPDTRRAGRFRYWQQQLLARIPGSAIGLEEFLAAFDGAPLQRPRAEPPASPVGAPSPDNWRKDAPAWVQEGRQLNEAEWLAGPHLIWMVWHLLHDHVDRPGEDRR